MANMVNLPRKVDDTGTQSSPAGRYLQTTRDPSLVAIKLLAESGDLCHQFVGERQVVRLVSGQDQQSRDTADVFGVSHKPSLCWPCHSQGLLHIGKRESVGLGGKLVEQLVGKLDTVVVGELVLPVHGVLSTFRLDGVGERAATATSGRQQNGSEARRTRDPTHYLRSNREGRLESAGSSRSKWFVVASYTAARLSAVTKVLYRETHTMSNPSLSSNPSTSLRKNDRLLSVINESISSKTTRHGASRRARSKTCLIPVRIKRDHVSQQALE